MRGARRAAGTGRRPGRTIRCGGTLLLLAIGAVPATSRGAAGAQVSAGVDFTCAVDASGGLSCWGRNVSGELGDGTTTARLTPTPVVGLGSGVSAVSAGDGRACAVTAVGGAKCWGRNDDGELGDGTTMGRLVPIDVSGLTSGVAAISVGSRHTCALTTGGGVKCWGDNTSGALGDGTTADSSTPVDVTGLGSGVVAVVAGSDFSCALGVGGGVKCWGEGSRGELGDGALADSSIPVDVAGLASDVTALSTTTQQSRASLSSGPSNPTCAVTSAGAVRCWGASEFNDVPAGVFDLTSGVVALDLAGYAQVALALLADGSVTTFDARSRLVRAPVAALADVVMVTAGDEHWCALSGIGEIRCWGANHFGAVGSGNTTSGSVGCVVGFGDEDFDRMCESYDPCVGGELFAHKPAPRLSAVRVLADPLAGNDQLSFRGRTTLPAGVAFADLDLAASGARVVILNPRGVDFERLLTPGAFGGKGTAGWASNGSGTRWTFKNATGPNGALRARLDVADRARGIAGGEVELNLRLTKETLPIATSDVPLGIVVILGDASAANAGICAQMVYGLCALNHAETGVFCG